MSAVELEEVSKRYADHVALRTTSLKIEEGEFYTLLGPSGCGKTTTLRLIAGFMQPSEGRILIDNSDVTRVPVQKRNVGIVFQGYALFPHMTVQANVAFALQQRRWSKAAINKRVAEMLELVELGEHALKYPGQLSGGQQQRVGLARALAGEPSVLLLDEPLGALDLKLRENLQLEIVRAHRDFGTTTVYVTHDQQEALRMSDRIAVVNKGQILQDGSPASIYDDPKHEFVANFIGKSNLLHGSIVQVNADSVDVKLTAPDVVIRAVAGAGVPDQVGSEVAIAIRPEVVAIRRGAGHEATSGGDQHLVGTVSNISYLGNLTHYMVEIPGGRSFIVEQSERDLADLGEQVTLSWKVESGKVVNRDVS